MLPYQYFTVQYEKRHLHKSDRLATGQGVCLYVIQGFWDRPVWGATGDPGASTYQQYLCQRNGARPRDHWVKMDLPMVELFFITCNYNMFGGQSNVNP